jgi:hypothetical protein
MKPEQVAVVQAERPPLHPPHGKSKRFLNALTVRKTIAEARGFADLINQPALAKLMLAERFQPDFYDYISALAMSADGGKVLELGALEAQVGGDAEPQAAEAKKGKGDTKRATPNTEEIGKWLEREWLQRWLKIEPQLADLDLRPYVFVARDKRILAGAAELGGLDSLIEKLSASAMALRSVEPEVKALNAGDAEAVFSALREGLLRAGNFTSQPPGLGGLGIVAKHHSRFQPELVALLSSLDVKTLGIWVVKGWNEVLTETAAKDQLRTLLTNGRTTTTTC